MIEASESASTPVHCKPAHSRLSSSGSVCRICHEGAKFGCFLLYSCTVNLFFIACRSPTLWIILGFVTLRNIPHLEYMHLLLHKAKSQISVHNASINTGGVCVFESLVTCNL